MQEAQISWFAVYTKPRQERIAMEHLQRQGYHCFLPMAVNPYQRNSAGKPHIEPLFPRYLFLRVIPNLQSLGPVRSTRGVASLVRFGTRLARLPEVVIRGLKHRCDPETGLVTLDADPIAPGDQVTVFDGPLAGLRGIFRERKGENRAILMMKMLGRASTVEVDALQLKKVV